MIVKSLFLAHQTMPVNPAPAYVQTQSPVEPTVTDLEYATVDDISLKLDLYLPDDLTQPVPVVVWVHGGGWFAGSKSSAIRAARLLVPHGYAVVGINYRLSQQALFPAQIHDVKAAIRWIRAHAADYNLDEDRIGAWGSSAGGHLVTLLGTSGDVSHYTVGNETVALEGAVGNNSHYSSRVQAVVNWYGPTDFLRMNDFPSQIDHNAADSPESRLLGAPIQDHPDRAALANPITYISEDDPPFLIMHGTDDESVPFNQSQLLYEALQGTLSSQGTEVIFEPLVGAGHGGEEFMEASVLNQVVTFFDRHLKQTPAR